MEIFLKTFKEALGVKLYAEPVLLAPEVGTPEF
jgi:hypothetical protein